MAGTIDISKPISNPESEAIPTSQLGGKKADRKRPEEDPEKARGVSKMSFS